MGREEEEEGLGINPLTGEMASEAAPYEDLDQR